MDIRLLEDRDGLDEVKNLRTCFEKMNNLLADLQERVIPEDLVVSINEGVEQVNQSTLRGKDLKKHIRKTYTGILKVLREELNLVHQNYHRDSWMAIGMSVFGISLGVVMGSVLDNMAFMGAFLPIGMVIGMAIGSEMDKKALQEGRQLPVTG